MTTTTGGHNCAKCGEWINVNEVHKCFATPVYLYAPMSNNELLLEILRRLDKIVELLELRLR